jgi:hypothetical protein
MATELVHSAEAQAAPAPEPTAEESEAIRRAVEVGRLLYRHDRAAWIATDKVSALKGFRKDKRTRGYITVPVADAIRVVFFGDGANGRRVALYRVDLGPDLRPLGEAEAFKEPLPLDEFESAAAAARQLAMSQNFQLCSKSYNTVILQDGSANDPSWAVYLMPAQTAKQYMLGGSYRIDVSGPGDRIVRSRGFTRSCIAMPNDKDLAAMTVTHLMDTTPTEIHVFTSLAAQKPVIVLTIQGESIWAVEDGTISLMERGKPERPALQSAGGAR